MRRFAELRSRDRLDVLGPAPARLNGVATDLASTDLEDLRLAEGELADLVGRSESLVARSHCYVLHSSLLDPIAERLVQERGYNGFSYADVAAELGVNKAGLHYHFGGKAELGEALMTRYANRFSEALAEIDTTESPAPAKLAAYAALYGNVLSDQRMCLCGMLAAEHQTLPPPMREVVLRFFDANERWLVGVLEGGRLEGTLAFEQTAPDTARLIVSALEGAMLVARPFADVGRFETAAQGLLLSLVAKPL